MPGTEGQTIPDRVFSRFCATIGHDYSPGACWPWLGWCYPTGYGAISWRESPAKKKTAAVHRIAWWLAHGPIPEDLTVDHMCRTRNCVNPAHLRLLTVSENSALNGHTLKTHCAQGHPYDEANTYRQPKYPTRRLCRACRTLSQSARRKRLRMPTQQTILYYSFDPGARLPRLGVGLIDGDLSSGIDQLLDCIRSSSEDRCDPTLGVWYCEALRR